MQNGYIESFNGKFRDECLNEHWFQNLRQARTEIAAWRNDYNEVRPTAALAGYRRPDTPSTYADSTEMPLVTQHPVIPLTFNPRTPIESLVRLKGAGQSPAALTMPPEVTAVRSRE